VWHLQKKLQQEQMKCTGYDNMYNILRKCNLEIIKVVTNLSEVTMKAAQCFPFFACEFSHSMCILEEAECRRAIMFPAVEEDEEQEAVEDPEAVDEYN
jgi:hypothetical protein